MCSVLNYCVNVVTVPSARSSVADTTQQSTPKKLRTKENTQAADSKKAPSQKGKRKSQAAKKAEKSQKAQLTAQHGSAKRK